MPRDKVTGSISGAGMSSSYVEWKIPRFVSLMKKADWDKVYHSPEFNACRCKWQFGVRPKSNSGWIFVTLVKVDAATRAETICTFAVKRADGTVEDIKSSGRGLMTYSKRFLSKSELRRRSSELLPSGALTILCRFRRFGSFQIPQIPFNPQRPALAGQAKLLSDIKNLYQNDQNTDVILNVKGTEFRAHRVILSMRSPVLSAMFTHDMMEKQTGYVNITDCEPEAFPHFIYFLYTGEIDDRLSPQNATHLYRAAEKYHLPDLKNECMEYLRDNVTVDNFCDVWALSLQHEEVMLQAIAIQFFSERSAEVVETLKWREFMSENVNETNRLIVSALAMCKEDNSMDDDCMSDLELNEVVVERNEEVINLEEEA